MALDVSEAVALAKDLLKTSYDFRSHDPDMADEFSNRAFEICDDLGIDRSLIEEQQPAVQPTINSLDVPAEQNANAATEDDVSPDMWEHAQESATPASLTPAEEASQANDQLHSLLQQQARVLQQVREHDPTTPEPKAKKRGFWPFRRPSGDYDDLGALQSA